MPLNSAVFHDIPGLRAPFPAHRLLASVSDASPDAMISQSLDGMIATWNCAAEKIFGYTADEAVGRPLTLIVPADLHAEELELTRRGRNGERIELHESIRLRRDGTRLEVRLTVAPITAETGEVIGTTHLIREAASSRRTSAATLLAAIVESSDDAIVSKDLNGIVTSWNRGAERIFGYTAAEMVGRSIETLFPPDRRDEEPRILARLRRGERVDHYQTVRRRKDGRLVDVSVTISPVRNGAGEVVGASKVARDITQDKLAVAQLARANEELKRADRMKSEFLAIMSHELRTPLNSIIGFASLLRQPRCGALTDEQRNHVNLIHASGKHLLGLINGLLDLSRIEAGRADLTAERFSPAEVILEAVRTLEPQAAQKKLAIRCELDRDVCIESDRQRFYQVVLNLLTNAIKFTLHGKVEVRAAVRDGRLVVSVADTGIGIPRERHGELFKAFSQLEGSARRRFDGTGLGLYLCKKVVSLLGGEIALESELHRGSVFTFWVPLQLPPQAAAESAESSNVPTYE